MNKVILAVLIAALVVGGYFFVKGGGSTEFGQPAPEDTPITSIQEIVNEGSTWEGKEVTVRGEMSQKCPTTGCWFYVKDDTGEIRVDTAPSGFTITEIPLGKTVTVHGKIVITEGGSEMVALGVKS